jgi:hypothetical protein
MKKFPVLIFTIALIVSLALSLKVELLYVSGSDVQNSSFLDFVAEIFGNVRALPSNQYRYNAKDNQNCGLDTIKIIANPQGGYLGIYHFRIGGLSSEYFQVRLARSADLLNWTFIRTVELQASQPTIAQAPNGVYIVAFEKHVFIGTKEERHVGFHYYPNLTCLLTGSEFYKKIANLTEGAQLEGTPNINNITIGNSIMNASVGFHYNDAYGLDNVAIGHLTVPLDNPKDTTRWNWTTMPLPGYNEKLRKEWNVKGHVGDRDYGQIFGRNFTLQEGNLKPPPINYSEYRIFLYDYLTGNFIMLNITTLQGSTSFGNPTFTFLKSPNGKDAMVVVTYLLFSEAAKTGEAGELIFYKEFKTEPFNLTYQGKKYFFNVTSNSTISNYYFNGTERSINFNVTGPDNSKGYCIVNLTTSFVQNIWNGDYEVLIDGKPPLDKENWTDTEDTYIYFTYQHSTHQVTIIIPEFPSAAILSLFTAISTFVVAFKRKLLRKPDLVG